ncbi:MAG: hypothetical protein ACJA01_000686 [Saprospiraceae bacterium]|jgi:hypothetical protein
MRILRDEVNYGKVVTLEHPELYNVEADIPETYDVSENAPQIITIIKIIIEEHKADITDTPPMSLS